MKRRRFLEELAKPARIIALSSLAWMSPAWLSALEGDAQAQITFQMGGMRDVQASIDATDCEVGDVVHVSLQAMTTGQAPDHPQLGTHPGFRVVSGPMIQTTRYKMQTSQGVTVKNGITATWTLRAEKIGSFTFTAPTANSGGTQITSNALKVRVVKPGTLPRSNGNFFDPFGGQGPSTLDPWKGFFEDDAPKRREPPATDPALSIDHDDSSPVFLHATIDKTSVVVGEQVTYTVFLYSDVDVSDHDFSPEHESTVPAFVRRPLVQDDAPAQLIGLAKVRNRFYRVKVIRKLALFPVSTGTLDIGAEEGRYPVGGRYESVKSEALKVQVADTPSAGRPPGYANGDTGYFELSATVNPRAIAQGDALAVNVTLKGTGNIPRATLPLPLQKDVVFLPPETSEKTELADNDKFAATDTFRYVVRIDRDGDVDLGEIDLPYFNPDKKKYAVARAVLGAVHVTKSDAQKAAPQEPNPVALPDMPSPVATLSGPRAAERRHVADSPWYLGAIFASPLAYAFLRGGAFATSRLKKRAKTRREDPKRTVEEHRREAQKALSEAHAKTLAATVKKYVEAQTIAFANVNVRSAPSENIATMLEDAGVKKETAKSAAEILADCSALAFRPDEPQIDEVSPLFTRAQSLEEAWTQ